MIEELWLKKFAKNSKQIGIIMMIAGVIGFVLPQLFSLTLSYFIGWLLLFAGFTQAYNAYAHKEHNLLPWLRPFSNLLVGFIFLVDSKVGVASLGLLLAFYFFIDAYASIALAQFFKAHKVTLWSIINAVISVGLGLFVLMNWPVHSDFFVGIFVGITLFFNGMTLLVLGNNIDKY